MPRNPYEKHEIASEDVGIVTALTGGGTAFANPMGGILNAQRDYHEFELKKIQKETMGEALANEELALQQQRKMQTAQVKASQMTYGKNGMTAENGFVQDSEGNVTYRGKK